VFDKNDWIKIYVPSSKPASKSPLLLVEIMSEYNYTNEGENELQAMLEDAFSNGTKVAWLIHNRLDKEKQKYGVEVLTSPTRTNELLTGVSHLEDQNVFQGMKFFPLLSYPPEYNIIYNIISRYILIYLYQLYIFQGTNFLLNPILD
jgi:hypothetical protein